MVKTTIHGRDQEFRLTCGDQVYPVDIVINHQCASDRDFYKVFLSQFLVSIDELTSKRLKVALHMIENMNAQNRFIGSQRDIARELKVSTKTVSDAIGILVGSGFLVKEYPSVYIINPALVFKGYSGARRTVLYQFESAMSEFRDKQTKKLLETEDQSESATVDDRPKPARRHRKKSNKKVA